MMPLANDVDCAKAALGLICALRNGRPRSCRQLDLTEHDEVLRFALEGEANCFFDERAYNGIRDVYRQGYAAFRSPQRLPLQWEKIDAIPNPFLRSTFSRDID